MHQCRVQCRVFKLVIFNLSGYPQSQSATLEGDKYTCVTAVSVVIYHSLIRLVYLVQICHNVEIVFEYTFVTIEEAIMTIEDFMTEKNLVKFHWNESFCVWKPRNLNITFSICFSYCGCITQEMFNSSSALLVNVWETVCVLGESKLLRPVMD